MQVSAEPEEELEEELEEGLGAPDEEETQMQPPRGPKTRESTVQYSPVGQEPLQDGAEAEQEMPEEELLDDELLELEEADLQRTELNLNSSFPYLHAKISFVAKE